MKVILTLLICGLLLYAGHMMTTVDTGVYVSYRHWNVACQKSVEEITCDDDQAEEAKPTDVTILEKPTARPTCQGKLSVVRYCAEYTLKKKAQ